MKGRERSANKTHIPVRTSLRSGWNRCDGLYWQEWDRISEIKERTPDIAGQAFWAGLNRGLKTGYTRCQGHLKS